MIDENKLRHLFYVERKRRRDIADILGVSFNQLNYFMQKNGITSESRKLKRDDLYDLYINKELSSTELGRLYNLDPAMIRRYIHRFNIDINDRYEKYGFNEYQHKLMIGSLLGDGCITRRKQDRYGHLSVSHAENQLEYLRFKFDIVKKLCNIGNVLEKNNKPEYGSYNKQRMFWIYTKHLPQFEKYMEMGIFDILDSLDVDSFCFWLFDDGYLDRKYYSIGMTRYGMDVMDYIDKVLYEKFNLKLVVDWQGKAHTRYTGFRFNKESSEIITDIIKKSVFYDNFKETMSYKLIS